MSELADAASQARASLIDEVRARGHGVSAYADGRVVVNAYTDSAAQWLRARGFTIEAHSRFPGRKTPGTFYECLLPAMPREPVDEDAA